MTTLHPVDSTRRMTHSLNSSPICDILRGAEITHMTQAAGWTNSYERLGAGTRRDVRQRGPSVERSRNLNFTKGPARNVLI